MDFSSILSFISNFFSAGWVAPAIAFFVGWLAIPMPSGLSSSWWGQLLSNLFGNQLAVQNIEQIISIVMAILQDVGVMPKSSPAPDAAMISRVIRGKMSLADAVKNHKAVIDSIKT